MPEVKLAVESRTEFGKGAARRIRRDLKVPGVLYGHGGDPIHITLPGHELVLALRTSNVLIALEIEGKNQLAIPKAIQRDAHAGSSSTSTCCRSTAARRSVSRSPLSRRATWRRAATCWSTC